MRPNKSARLRSARLPAMGPAIEKLASTASITSRQDFIRTYSCAVENLPISFPSSAWERAAREAPLRRPCRNIEFGRGSGKQSFPGMAFPSRAWGREVRCDQEVFYRATYSAFSSLSRRPGLDCTYESLLAVETERDSLFSGFLRLGPR